MESYILIPLVCIRSLLKSIEVNKDNIEVGKLDPVKLEAARDYYCYWLQTEWGLKEDSDEYILEKIKFKEYCSKKISYLKRSPRPATKKASKNKNKKKQKVDKNKEQKEPEQTDDEIASDDEDLNVDQALETENDNPIIENRNNNDNPIIENPNNNDNPIIENPNNKVDDSTNDTQPKYDNEDEKQMALLNTSDDAYETIKICNNNEPGGSTKEKTILQKMMDDADLSLSEEDSKAMNDKSLHKIESIYVDNFTKNKSEYKDIDSDNSSYVDENELYMMEDETDPLNTTDV